MRRNTDNNADENEVKIKDGSHGKKKREKKRWTKKKIILLSLFGALVITAVVLTVCYWDLLKLAWMYLTGSPEEYGQNLVELKVEQATALNNANLHADKDGKMFDALTRGEITEEQFKSILLGNLTLEDAIKQNTAASDKVNDVLTDEQSKADSQMIDALNSGSITKEQFENILLGKLTLEAALEQNKKQTEAGTPDTADSPTDSPTEDKKQPEEVISKDVVDAYNKGEIDNRHLIEISNNNMTLDEAKKDKTESVKPVDPPKQETPKTDTADKSVDEQIASLVTKMYVLKGEYEAVVKGIVNQMISDYAKLPKEQQTKSAKASIAAGYTDTINAKEAQCDAQVDAIDVEPFDSKVSDTLRIA